MIDNKYSFSIFTPTYNRAKDLINVYNCLKDQEYKNFEWIIIDDGSTDNTKKIVQQFILDKCIPITYYYQENRGKHVAQNRALDIAKGYLFLPLDSDDLCTSDALKAMWETWTSIPENKRKNYSGIGVLCGDKNGNVIGDRYPNDYFESNDLELYFKYKIKGEKWGPIRTDIMLLYKNQEAKGHFLSENTVWFRIAKSYNKLCINKICRIYEIHADSVSKKNKEKQDFNFDCYAVGQTIMINEFNRWYFKYRFREYLKMPIALTIKSIKNSRPILKSNADYSSVYSLVTPPMQKFSSC